MGKPKQNVDIRLSAVEQRVDFFVNTAHSAQNQRIEQLSNDVQKVMANFVDPSTFKHFLILNGQRLEADVAYTQIYGMAKGVSIKIFSEQHGKHVPRQVHLPGFRDRQREAFPLRGVLKRCGQQDHNHHAAGRYRCVSPTVRETAARGGMITAFTSSPSKPTCGHSRSVPYGKCGSLRARRTKRYVGLRHR